MSLKQIRHFIPITLILCAPFFMGFGWVPLRGVSSKGEKVYFGSPPTQNTPAYQAFLLSPKTESSKLYYLLDRIKGARDLVYIYEGNHYNWMEAYAAACWLQWHDYKKGESALSFIRREALDFETSPAKIQFTDRSIHLAYHIFINELDWLENTIKIDVQAQPTHQNEKARLP